MLESNLLIYFYVFQKILYFLFKNPGMNTFFTFYELFLSSSENPLNFHLKIQERALCLLLKMPVMRKLCADAKFLVNDLGKYLEKIFDIFCTPESLNTNISHQLFEYIITFLN